MGLTKCWQASRGPYRAIVFPWASVPKIRFERKVWFKCTQKTDPLLLLLWLLLSSNMYIRTEGALNTQTLMSVPVFIFIVKDVLGHPSHVVYSGLDCICTCVALYLLTWEKTEVWTLAEVCLSLGEICAVSHLRRLWWLFHTLTEQNRQLLSWAIVTHACNRSICSL